MALSSRRVCSLALALGLLLALPAAPPVQLFADSGAAPIKCPPDLDPRLPPPPNCPRPGPVEPWNFCLRLQRSATADAVELRVGIAAIGEKGGDHVLIRLPFDGQAADLLAVEFNRPGPWVSAVSDGLAVLSLGPVERGDVITATVRLRPPSGGETLVDGRAQAFWSNDGGAAPLLSNRPLAAGDGLLELAPGRVVPGQPAAARFDGFSAEEPVSFWVTAPDGASQALGRAVADAAGRVGLDFTLAGLAPDAYLVVAQGACSGLTVTGALELAPLP